MTLLELLQLLRKHLRLVIALPLVCALVMGVYSYLFMPNAYTASTSMYVLVKGDSTTKTSMSQDLSASQMIANDVSTLIKSRHRVRANRRSLKRRVCAINKINVVQRNHVARVSLTVTGEDAASTAIIANELAKNVSSVAQSAMDVQSVNVIDEAITPTSPSGPNRIMYTAVAFLAGLFVAIAIVVLMDMLNTRVRGAEDVEELLGIPVIGRIPSMKGAK